MSTPTREQGRPRTTVISVRGKDRVALLADPELDGVVFMEVVGFPGYKVGDNGEVWSSTWGRWKKLAPQYASKCRYLKVTLRKNKKTFQRYVHRLVLEAFVGPCPEGMETRHLNGNNQDNRLTNLAWGTIPENKADMVRHGNSTRGEKNSQAKITSGQANLIRAEVKGGDKLLVVAARYGISRSQVQRIVRGECWSVCDENNCH